MTTNGPQSDVGWNRDLLEQTRDDQDTLARPLGFDSLATNPDSGSGLRHRMRHDTQDESEVETASVTESRERGRHEREGPLTRHEMREARLLRLGGEGRERQPLSELSRHSFTFKN